MGTPYRQTPDGFELQMATNHLGHFALTGLLLNRLITSGRSRVVTVSSVMHRLGHIDFDDVAGLQIRNTWSHYGNSKLANLLFSAELSRRLQEAGESVLAVAAHPGWTRSNLIGNGAALGTGKVRAKAGRAFGTFFGQTAAAGAGPTLYAATSPEVRSGQFIGPSHVAQLFGAPTVVHPNRRAQNRRRRGASVGDLREADRRALSVACARLNRARLNRARLNQETAGAMTLPAERPAGFPARSLLHEGGMRGEPLRTDHPAQRHDEHRAGAARAGAQPRRSGPAPR